DIGKLGEKGLDLTYAPSTITTQKPTKGELDLLFEAMYDDYIGGKPLAAPRTALAAQDVDELETQQHVQHQPASIADNVLNAMFDENTFVNTFATPSTNHSGKVIGEPSRPVLSWIQLRYDGDMCMYAINGSNCGNQDVKEDMDQSCMDESMQYMMKRTRSSEKSLVWFCGGVRQRRNRFFARIIRPVARMEANQDNFWNLLAPSIRLTVFQMDLKKALSWVLKQAPRAWYDELSTFLLQNHFFKGTIDPTLFIRRFVDEILWLKVYVDDFYSLVLHTLVIPDPPVAFFINQFQLRARNLLKNKWNGILSSVGTPMEIKDKLDLDKSGTLVDATKYRSMIGALMYLTSSRPDILYMLLVYCAGYQASQNREAPSREARKSCVSWSSMKQGLYSLSTARAEYVVIYPFVVAHDHLDADTVNGLGLTSIKIQSTVIRQSAIGHILQPVTNIKNKTTSLSAYHFISEQVWKWVRLEQGASFGISGNSLCGLRLAYNSFHDPARNGGIYPGTLLLDRVKSIGMIEKGVSENKGDSAEWRLELVLE
ncbi:retrovirus-related pol polyprotein from transposon TNT 1-94, partial [Tanacetum coccineum]